PAEDGELRVLDREVETTQNIERSAVGEHEPCLEERLDRRVAAPLPPTEHVGPGVGISRAMQAGEPTTEIEEAVSGGRMALPVHIEPVRGAGRAEVNGRARPEGPATPGGGGEAARG